MAQDGSLLGLIDELRGRSEGRKLRDAQRNYLTDPEASIAATNEINPNRALEMRTAMEARNNQMTTQRQASEAAESERYTGALRNMAGGLGRVAAGGGDVGAAFDQMVPVMQNGFRMQPEEIAQWREQITSNPEFLPQLNQFLRGNEVSKFRTAGPGSAIYDEATGQESSRVPFAPRTAKLRRGDGGEELFVIDGDGNLVESHASQPGATGGPAGVPSGSPLAPGGAPGTAGYGGPRNINPQARGVRNHNQGNIKDGPWARRQPGYAGNDGTFARFNSPEAGNAAQETLLRDNYVNGRRTIGDIVDKYLGFPGSGENSRASRDNYTSYVAGRTGLDPNVPVNPEHVGRLAQAMREFENGGGGGGGAAPAPARGGAAASTPGKPVEQRGWRNMTPAERAARPGLDQTREYQIGVGGANEGKVQAIPGAPRPRAGRAGPNGGAPGTISAQAHHAAVSNLTKVRDEARGLRTDPNFAQATGSIQGRLPSLRQGSVDFDRRLGSFVGRTVVDALLTMKQNSPNGATGFGSMNATEGNWLRDSQGAFSASSPVELARNLQIKERDAMISIGMAYNIMPEATTYLLNNPRTRAQFDSQFGAGMAQRILGR